MIFEQDAEVPKDWSMTTIKIVAGKYLHGPLGKPSARAASAPWLLVWPRTIRDRGIAGGYFRSAEDAAIFRHECACLLLQQTAVFNSPVWFNVGCDRIEPDSDAQLTLECSGTARGIRCHGLQDAAVFGMLHQLGTRFTGPGSSPWRRPKACSST
jgi:hypothetical protein